MIYKYSSISSYIQLALTFLSICSVVRCQYISGGFTINDNQYTLRWEISGSFITFRVVARGTGYVGFGLSPTGSHEGSDVFVAGIKDDGTVYHMDVHGAKVEKDAMDNYHLLFVRQSAVHTEIHFRRRLFTMDCKEDIRIMNEPQYVMWGIGPPMDAMEAHDGMNAGKVLVNLLNPPMYHSYYMTNKTMMDPMCSSMGMGNEMGKEGMSAAAMEPDAEMMPEKIKEEPMSST